MANFCTKCGTPIDQPTGLCPNCDRDALAAMQQPAAPKLKKT